MTYEQRQSLYNTTSLWRKIVDDDVERLEGGGGQGNVAQFEV